MSPPLMQPGNGSTSSRSRSDAAAANAERRVVTALFCDVVGSTTIAETMDPEDWSDLVSTAIVAMADPVERFGGTVSQFAGDGILALFGAPIAHEDDPYRAVRAGIAIIDSIRSLHDSTTPLNVRVGIHTGLVVAGDIDAGDLSVYSAVGDTLNVAARLQTLAAPGTIVLSGATRSLLGDDVEVREIGPVDLKGRAGSVNAYEVVSVRGTSQRRRGIAGMESPMLGRDAELGRLRELLDATASGSGQVVAILGEPGVGKTRLVEEFTRAEQNRARLALGRCVAYDEQLPYHLIAAVMESLAGVEAFDEPGVISKAMETLTEEAGRPDDTETLMRMLGLAEAGDAEPEDLRDAYARTVSGVVAKLASQSPPLVLVCEDTHWADRSSVDLIAGLLERASSTAVMLVIVMRADRDSEGWRLLSEAREILGEALAEIELSALDETVSRRLVQNLLEIESLPVHLRNMVLAKADGNPFFLEEVVRMLIEHGVVEERDGRWFATSGIAEIEVPATVHGLLVSRIDRLPTEVRRAGRVAAVIGRRFSADLLADVHPVGVRDSGEVHPHVAALEEHSFVRRVASHPRIEFEFRHALIHDVMYAGLLKRERRDLHRQVAESIERSFPDRLDEHAAALARHYIEAGNRVRATRYLLTAGHGAEARGARPEAYRFFDEAVRLVDDSTDPETRLDAMVGRARSGTTFVPAPETLADLEAALGLAETLGDPHRLARIYVLVLNERNMQGESYATEPYRSELQRAYELVPLLEDEATRAMLHGMMGLAHRSADEYEASIELLSKAVADLERVGRLSEASYDAGMLAVSYSALGRFDEARAMVNEAFRLGMASGDPNATADADLTRAIIAAEQGDLEAALLHARRGTAAAEAAGNTYCSLAGNFMVGDQYFRRGDFEKAISHLERTTGLAEYCHAGGYEALGEAWLAAARARIGELDLAAFDGPLEKATATRSRSGEALVRLHRAVATADAGSHSDAFEDFERAIELFSDYGGLPSLARAHHAYAQALRAAGRLDDAESHLGEADTIFTRLGMQADPVAPLARG